MRTSHHAEQAPVLSGILRSLGPILVAGLMPFLLTGCFLWSGLGSSDNSDESVEAQEEEEDRAEVPESEAKEIKSEDSANSSETPEQELVRTAKRLYQAGMYSVAQDSLTSIRDRYPLGAYGSWAAIKAADACYYNGEFDKAAKSFEDFLKNYPGSPDTPYVKLQAARAHLASAKGTGRDRQPLERSLTLFDELEHDYPGTPYAVLARSERTPALEDLVAYDRFIMDFYRKKGNDDAVAARQKLFDERWGPRWRAGEFKETSEEIALEPLPEIEPGSEQALQAEAVEAREEEAESPPEVIAPEVITVRHVQCNTQDIPSATIELSRFPESYSAGNVLEKIEPDEGVVRVPDLSVSAERRSFDCFSQGDLSIGGAGEIELRSAHGFILTTLAAPPRILLTRIAN